MCTEDLSLDVAAILQELKHPVCVPEGHDAEEAIHRHIRGYLNVKVFLRVASVFDLLIGIA